MAKYKGPVLYPPRIFSIYKPAGMSSCKVVSHFKRHLPDGYGKIGHFGTLDPFADGLLLIGIAGACRLNNPIQKNFKKVYRAKGILGIQTSSADCETLDDTIMSDLAVDNKLQKFTPKLLQDIFTRDYIGKKYLQIPPAFSASKHQGKALYKWARQGEFIVKEPVEREIYSIDIQSLNGRELTFDVSVSTGTYIRTLFEDMAKKLGTYGYLESLTRLSIGDIHIKDSLRPNQWPMENQHHRDYVFANSYEVREILNYQTLKLGREDSMRFSVGNPVTCEFDLQDADDFFIYNSDDKILGVGVVRDGKVLPKINFRFENP